MRWQDVLARAVLARVAPMLLAAAVGAMAAAGLIPAEVRECVSITLDPPGGDGV